MSLEDRNWSAFMLDAECENVGHSRIASVHNALRARIAELQARLTLAEKVVEAAEWFSGKIHWSAAHTIGVEFELKTFREALAAWRAQKH